MLMHNLLHSADFALGKTERTMQISNILSSNVVQTIVLSSAPTGLKTRLC